MTIIPIQVTDEGVLIPKSYLRDAGAFEVIVSDDYVLVRPKVSPKSTTTETEESQLQNRYSFIGIGHTREPNVSVEAEAILEDEIKRASGWSLD
jgi:hypothetical protein